jgi:hypothetical protein
MLRRPRLIDRAMECLDLAARPGTGAGVTAHPPVKSKPADCTITLGFLQRGLF